MQVRSRPRTLRGKLLFYGAITTHLATPAIALLEASLAGTVDWRTFLGRLLPLLLLDGILIVPLWIFLHRSILRPLQALTRADRAVEAGQAGGRYIPQEAMPDHELGEVMRARNAMLSRLEELQARAEARRREEEEAATRLAHSLLGVATFEEIGAAAFSVLRERLAPDALSLLVIDPSESMLELVAAEGWAREYIGRLQLPLSPPETSGAAWALHTRTPVVKDHTAPSPASSTPDPVREAGVQMSLHLPMVSGERSIGVLALDYLTPRDLPEEEVRFAALISGVVAVTVERVLEHRRNRLLFERVPVGLYRSTPEGRLLDANDAMVRLLGYPDRETLLRTDAVRLYVNPEDRRRWQDLMDWEGVYNRRRFQEELQGRIAQARRAGASGALLFLDLDNFKEVNDRLGHRAGDDLLRAVIQHIRRTLRETDILGRVGGDEFAILLFPADAPQARAAAERVLEAVREHVVLLAGRPVRLTCSCGISLFPDHGMTVDEVLSAADTS